MLASRKILCLSRPLARLLFSDPGQLFGGGDKEDEKKAGTRTLLCLWDPLTSRRWVRHVPLAVPFLLNCGARGDKTWLSRLATTTRGR